MASKSERTQSRIIEAAREEFAKDGYSDAALTEIISKAGVTTGAIYYHYKDKKGLFQAVAETLEQEILDHVTDEVKAGGDPWEVFERAVVSTLEICARSDIQRIVFRDAPTVIGLQEWRKIELAYSFGLMQKTVRDLTDAKLIKSQAPDTTAQIFLGALMEAAHTIAEAKNKSKARKAAITTLQNMMRGLKSKK